MAERPLEQLTLREIFTNAELLIRDLEDHLLNAFQPKARSLDMLVRSHNVPSERDAISDGAVRHHVAAVLSSNDYSESLIQKLDLCLTAIEEKSLAAISAKK